MAVSGAADPEVLALGPVEEVVAAFPAGAGPVGDLVPGAAGGLQHGVGGQIPVGLIVVVGGGDVAGSDPPGQGRAGFHGEGVGADVGRVEGQGGGEGGPPVSRRLAGRAVDEVHVEVVEPAVPGRLDGPLDAGRVVGPPEGRQHVGGHRLHPEGEPVHAAGPVGGEQLRGHRVGVALHRHLGARRPGDGVEDGHQQLGGQQRGRPATEEDARRRGNGPGVAVAPQVGHAGGGVGLHEVVAVGPGGEVAVVTPPGAERHVDVHTERHTPGA